jgi:hypothetical protein
MGNDQSVTTQKLQFNTSFRHNDTRMDMSMVVNNNNVQAMASNGMCTTCIVGHTTQDGKTFHISSFSKTGQKCTGIGLKLLCWMLDKVVATQVVDVTLDVNGEIHMLEKTKIAMSDKTVAQKKLKAKTVAERLANYYQHRYGFKRVDTSESLHISMKTTANELRARCASQP